VPHGSTVAPPVAVGHSGRGLNLYSFCLNLDEGKLYNKIVAFNEIYNFVDKNFSI
jgi:hypothetical protein